MTNASAACVAGVVLTRSEAHASRMAHVTPETFESHRGEKFRLEDEQGNVVYAKLESVETLVRHPGIERQPFSLMFRAAEGKEIAQDVYHVKHARLGAFRLLLVPVDHRPHHNQLQAVFS